MIPVYVCVAGTAEPLRECLEALGDGARIVRGQTVWEARSTALAEADAELIAFVDGDVVVAAGWSEQLADAWRRADWQIGAIGGPIEDDSAISRSALGDKQIDFDPLERTLPAGNLSFRRRALLGAGGFAATVDGRDARDWLAEEHEAERQLGHWGWLVRYDPALLARRIGGWGGAPRAGRFRYGMRLGMTRARAARTATPAMGRAAAATAVATLRGDGARRSESAARAAENAGVLAGALRPRPEAHPRASGPQLGGSAGRAPSAPFILLYHRIADPAADPLKLCVSPEHFEEHLAALEQDFTVVSMDEMAAERAAGAVAITFDDGYADNVAAFAQLELPVTLYAATGHIAEQRPFFWDELAALFSQGDQPTLTVEIDGRRLEWPTRNPEERQAAMRDLHRRLQPTAPETIEAALTQVRAWARSGATPPPLMTVDDLRGLGVDVGAHTVRHLNLAHQTRDVLEAEVTGSRDAVAEWTGSSPRGFSYPFGLPRHDVDDVAMRVVEEAGFDYAVVNQPTPVLAEADRFALPRLFAPNVSGAELRAWLRPIVC